MPTPDMFLSGPALSRWLPSIIGGRGAAVWLARGAGRGLAGRAVLRGLRRLPRFGVDSDGAVITPGPDHECRVAIIVAPLGGPGPSPDITTWLEYGGREVIELAHRPRHTLASLARPRVRARMLRIAAFDRARLWLRAGLLDHRQWTPVGSRGLLVTYGRMRKGG